MDLDCSTDSFVVGFCALLCYERIDSKCDSKIDDTRNLMGPIAVEIALLHQGHLYQGNDP